MKQVALLILLIGLCVTVDTNIDLSKPSRSLHSERELFDNWHLGRKSRSLTDTVVKLNGNRRQLASPEFIAPQVRRLVAKHEDVDELIFENENVFSLNPPRLLEEQISLIKAPLRRMERIAEEKTIQANDIIYRMDTAQ